MEKILILTPVKDACPWLEGYFSNLANLTWPHELISLGLLESDSKDDTYNRIVQRIPELQQRFARAAIWQKSFGFHMPEGMPRWEHTWQTARRAALAKSRNYLLFRALDDEAWVLWLDVDVIEYPPDIIERLLVAGKEIVTPHCVHQYGGRSFDLNAWRDRGRRHLHDLRGEGDLVRLDAVGGTMLLVRADLHRQGLVFPPFLYGKKNRLIRRFNWFTRRRDLWKLRSRPFMGEIETEGLGMMAHDMGYECWGMPNLEIRHREG
jgi:hypothetical protein